MLTFAITKVLEPIVDVISQVNFKLSGNVDNPDFKEIERQQKKHKVTPHTLEKAGISIAPIEENVEEPIKSQLETIDELKDTPIIQSKSEAKASL